MEHTSLDTLVLNLPLPGGPSSYNAEMIMSAFHIVDVHD